MMLIDPKCPRCEMPLGTGETGGMLCFSCVRASRPVKKMVMIPKEEYARLKTELKDAKRVIKNLRALNALSQPRGWST